MKRIYSCLLACILCCNAAWSQSTPDWEHGFWNARWISHPDAVPNGFGVYHFRKELQLDVKPSAFIIHVSADNQYRLYVNGTEVSSGPARSDLANWNYETVDLAPFLRAGKNIVSSTVWNFSDFRGYAQASFETAFIIQGNSADEFTLNTGKGWKVTMDSAYQPLPIERARLQTYLAVASGEVVDGNKYAWGFASASEDKIQWKDADILWYGAKAKSYGTDGNWQLVKRTIPMPETYLQQFLSERSGFLTKEKGTEKVENSFPWKIPANTKVSLLLDQGTLTNAFPQLQVSGGQNSIIQLTYAEAMIDSHRVKGNRNEVKGKELIGIADRYISDGGMNRLYAPLQYRTFRYIKVEITTGAEGLTIDKMDSRYIGYPFKEKAKFNADDQGLQNIWDVGWRTARLCAVDTYFDCPYYEQLQYVGDTRIQALISLYVSGDDRLMKKAIDDISHSFIPEGLTQSRYPSRDLQVIPTFSLWWVCMVHDHFIHRKDDEFIKGKLNGIASVLQWYDEKMAPNGMLGPLSWWQFVDWSWPWVDSIRVGGVPPGVSKGGSSIVSLQYAYTLVRASELMKAYGRPEMAAVYNSKAQKIRQDVYRLCWDAKKGLLADTYEKREFSQHANILAILTDAVPVSSQPALLKKLMTDSSLTRATYYFKFYMFEAMKKTGLGNEYLGQLKPWYDMLDIGLTTFAENPEPTRSDCHAWSASPLYEMLSMVAGVMPASPGFEKVMIKPHPGNLDHFTATVPHPKGDILVEMKKSGWNIELPPGLTGTFEWKGKRTVLKTGKQLISN